MVLEEQEGQHLNGAPIAPHLADSGEALSRDDEACLSIQQTMSSFKPTAIKTVKLSHSKLPNDISASSRQ